MKAAVYVRISRPDEAEILKNQIERCETYVKKRGWELIETYQDIASGGKADRPGYVRMLQDAGQRWEVVVFSSLSRMTRQGIRGALYSMDRLKTAGAGWHFTDQPMLNWDDNTNPMVKDVMLALLAALDEDFRRSISARTREALNRRKNAGIRLGRHPKDCDCKKHGKVSA